MRQKPNFSSAPKKNLLTGSASFFVVCNFLVFVLQPRQDDNKSELVTASFPPRHKLKIVFFS
jgi:hypothetical protein